MNKHRELVVLLGCKMLFDPCWAWHAAIELGEILPYQERRRRANPLMGVGLKYADTQEYGRAFEFMRTAEVHVTHRASHS